MATSLDCLASVTLNATLSNTAGVIGAGVATLAKIYGSHFTQGTGAGQCDLAWWSERPLAASTSEILDLAGVLVDPYGSVITFARIKAIGVYAAPTNTNNVIVGGAASNTFVGLFGSATHTAVVRPGAYLSWGCGSADTVGYPVASGTGDQLQVLNGGSGTTITYDVVVLGCSV